jgi:hypothetical protein
MRVVFGHYFSFLHSPTPCLALLLLLVAWVILAFLVARWTKFFGTLWSSDSDANRSLLRVAALGLGIVTSLVLYLSLYLPKIKGIDSSAWNVYCPRVIPTMAAVGVTSYLIFLRATWPVWGFLAPLVSGTQFMGILMALHFVPAMNVC